MTARPRKPYAEREQAARMAFARRVATDPGESPDDIQAARLVIGGSKDVDLTRLTPDEIRILYEVTVIGVHGTPAHLARVKAAVAEIRQVVAEALSAHHGLGGGGFEPVRLGGASADPEF